MSFSTSSPQPQASPSLEGNEKSPRPQFEKLFGHCSRINKINIGDVVTVGGSIYSAGSPEETYLKLISDFGTFKDFYKKAQDKVGLANLEQLRGLLDSADCEMSEKTFAQLLAFTRSLAVEFPNASEHVEGRSAFYKKAQSGLKLSDAFKEGGAACAEISILAQGFLQEIGLESSLFNGEVLWNKKSEFAEEHTFILFNNNGKTYIYDPTNPIMIGGRPLPCVYVPVVDFNSEVSKSIKRFVTSINVVTKGDAYYGVGDHTDITPEKDIV